MINTHMYQPHVATSSLLPCHQHPLLNWEKKNKEKEKEREEDRSEETNDTTETSNWENLYSTDTRPKLSYIPLRYKDCKKKLFSMGAWIIPDEDYWMQTHYYCKLCHHKHYEYPKRQNKWDNEPCLAYGKQLLDKGMWNNIPK
ncbi:hypothetical protein G9A89_018772 [Geosiphon pyriformis]|nr:hypothetical protein G9A89_018772 [Geosiphon pyriformis]